MEKTYKVNPDRFKEPAIIDYEMSEFLDLLVPTKVTVATIVLKPGTIFGISMRGKEFSIEFDDDRITAFGYRHPVGSRAFDMAVTLGFYTETTSLDEPQANHPDISIESRVKVLEDQLAAQKEEIAEMKEVILNHAAAVLRRRSR